MLTAADASSASDLTSAYFGLAGALIGGLATFLGVWWRGSFDARQARRERKAVLCEEVIAMKLELIQLTEKLNDARARNDGSNLDHFENELRRLQISSLVTMGRLSVTSSKRVSKAVSHLIEVEGDREIGQSIEVMAAVVRGEVSPSLVERIRIRFTSIESMKEQVRENWAKEQEEHDAAQA